ncbi:hypothetical protein BDB01DRAFT_797633 [Pilobolus umbonatus]|nr:hypothetical protein BDB01DRAFT_797633 [Pilobolus umbonatus]
MNTEDIKAPGEKVDIRETSLYDYIHTDESHLDHERKIKFKEIPTAHIQSEYHKHHSIVNTELVHNHPNAHFAYDELVLACVEYLGCTAINETAKKFADGIVTLIGLPNALDPAELKRRMEQLLPVNDEIHYKHSRGMLMSNKDCAHLCSLADRVINFDGIVPSNLNIIDYDNDLPRRKSSGGEVHYVRRQSGQSQPPQLPNQLPNFVEKDELDAMEKEEYDKDITPFDSDREEPTPMLP